jgi:hypothetical protein
VGTRDVRRAAAVLDHVARDFENAVLVRKPPDVDPLVHPWLFFAEARGAARGANRVKFVRRGHAPRRSAARESDLEVVSYAVRRDDDDTLSLLRASATQLPEGLDRGIPADETDGALLLAEGLADFGLAFVDETGQRSERWDSASVEQADRLPAAVEIEVAFANPDDPEAEPLRWRRRVVLPLRPLDLAELLDPSAAVSGGEGTETADEDEEDDEGAKKACAEGPCAQLTVCQAIDCASQDNPSFRDLLAEIGSQPFCARQKMIPTTFRWAIQNPACR